MGTTPPPLGTPTVSQPKQHKTRRKISLPWFRQSSVSTPHAALSRQHTIDTPSSFHARLLKGGRQRQAGPEMTWVVAEHIANGTAELSVTKGQQVEVVEAYQGRAEWWVVRLPGETPQEGAVPAHVLKPQPQQAQKTSPSRRPLSQPCDEALEPSSSEAGGSVSAASPGKHRKGLSGRRWLGLRKPSQGKTEKTPSGAQSPATTDKSVALKKVPSDKKIKLPYGANADSGKSETSGESNHSAAAALDEVEDDAPDVELPPPMKPLVDPLLQPAPTPAASTSTPITRSSLAMDALDSNGGPADIAEIEQIVKEKMVREQHGNVACCSTRGENEEPSTPGPDTVEATLRNREYVLRELVETEEIYVADLRLVCEGYMRHMQDPNADPPLPEGLRDRRNRMIFGNIEAIYEWHRDKFLNELRACIEAPESLGPLFRRFLDKRMVLYETYCRNKPMSEYIVSEYDHYFQELRQKLGHKLQLGDLLIKPIQRIQKYHLLVKKIAAATEAACALPNVIAAVREALHCASIIPKNANDMMIVGRLQGFAGNITAQGKLLLQESLMVSDLCGTSDRSKELHVFLFEQCVIFSEVVGKKSTYTSPTYNYKAHIQVNKMDMEERDGAFVIRTIDSTKSKLAFLCRAPEEQRLQWISSLSRILQSQKIFGEALENPGAYLRELHREANRDPVASLRKTESVPPSMGARMAPELRGRTQRPHVKANTINLPTSVRPEASKLTVNVAANNSAVSPTSPPHANGLSKRAWGLKLRRGGGGGEPGAEGVVTELRPPELVEAAADVTVTPGAAATISCRATITRASISWRKTAPETRALRHGGRLLIKFAPDGLATLTIHGCRASDAGVYSCLISNELGGVQSSARLTVGSDGTPGLPAVRAHPGGGLVVQWDEKTPVHLDYCRVGEGEWRRATETPAPVNTLALEELPAGQYSFRLVCARSGAPGAATEPAACGGGGGWQREQFTRRYTIEEEIGRGRTSRVLAARDNGTGQRVAIKQVLSGRGADALREYRIVSRGAHGAVVRALALFAEVPRTGAHSLVLELVGGGPLLEWAATTAHNYTQQLVAHHTRQLLSALHWLHNNNVAHLDVRPENILVELSGQQPQLKLIDLGSAVEMSDGGVAVCGREVLPPAPAQLEFAPPECVLGRPPAPCWDAWAAGVFLYVFLTGLSPFLDESIEETTANIIKCDYCFPPEHWAGVGERAQQVIRGLLAPAPRNRLAPGDALNDAWFDDAPPTSLSATQLKTFLDRRRPAGHGNVLHSLRSPDT